ncbi:GNAT family N-acetyltransferase [Guptibacillus hwajinpoensis]|uniref:GNAT family N-acetyltransferase n=1 Tax=Guptibacillus hwajinpoensis TaxID=208199 RepID=UPI001CFEFD03|nr:GNAT family N-acetyltransferase [Pseudalkalibacillus hwajinpoensis]WLR59483.1 GNAT family N-acetyltransferase [Pseudalkalibacillus hwajinpoensis]
MNVYQLSSQADEDMIEKVSKLLMKQITRSDQDGSYDKLVKGVKLALEEQTASRIVVAESEDEVLGVAFFNIGVSLSSGGPYIWLNELFVDPDARNRGIGRKLLLHVIYWAENEGIKGIELETGIHNAVTKHLYNSLGFHDIISKRYGFTFSS